MIPYLSLRLLISLLGSSQNQGMDEREERVNQGLGKKGKEKKYFRYFAFNMNYTKGNKSNSKYTQLIQKKIDKEVK